jgi:hypothetical protein
MSLSPSPADRHSLVIPGRRASVEPGIHFSDALGLRLFAQKQNKTSAPLSLFAANAASGKRGFAANTASRKRGFAANTASRKRGVVMDSGPIAARCPGMTTKKRESAFPRHGLPEVCFRPSPSNRGRREDRVHQLAPAALCARVGRKTHTRSSQVRRNTGLPCAMVYGLLRALLGVPAS